ncbi:hypothetical protein GGS24DRAFT_14432 [Hypoxylon argillaceum]|nr:hypothetical protein GGS24DRAFT_14432 [Hypoxylon argillaceum]
MSRKESTSLLSLCSSFQILNISSSRSCITSSCSGTRPSLRASREPCQSFPRRNSTHMVNLRWSHPYARCYASASSPHAPKRSSSAIAGYTWPISLYPTPYEILAHSKDARYNKALFYELVKIYHPDRNETAADSSISQSVRLERYRLVVAANEILSDDAKRRAYDLYGAGWNGNRTLQSVYREADRSWRNEPGNASRNATWEDWEQWRREKNGEKQPQTPVFMSNELFVIVLCSLVVVASFSQARRASATSSDVVEMREQKHGAISDDMRRRQSEKAPLNRHERVESFLRQRHSWNVVSSGNNSPRPPS